jgi:hypothetical protein
LIEIDIHTQTNYKYIEMATREKKAKATTESPTPSSTPSTPTTKAAAATARSSRIRNQAAAGRGSSATRGTAATQNDNDTSSDEEVLDKATEDAAAIVGKDEKVSGIEEIKSLATKDEGKKDETTLPAPTPATPTSAAKRKKELEARKAALSKQAEATVRKKRTPQVATPKGARNSGRGKAADADKLRKAGGIAKRKSLPILVKKGGVGSNDRRHSTGKIEMLKETIAKDAKRKPRAAAADAEENKPLRSPARKRRPEKEEPAAKSAKDKQIKLEAETDSDAAGKSERTRSDSVSTKCSDVTDISTMGEKEATNSKDELDEKAEEAGDKPMSKAKALDKMAESFEKKLSEILPAKHARSQEHVQRKGKGSGRRSQDKNH